jgi:signal peptidase
MAVSVPLRLGSPYRTPSFLLGLVGSALFGLVIGALVIALFATQFLGYRVATIQSFSMEPALDRGDLILVRPTSINDADVGDIVLFEEGQNVRMMVAHRVDGVFNVTTNVTDGATGKISVSTTKVLRTKGDANDKPDPEYVSADRYRGKLLLTVPNAGLIGSRVPLQQLLLLVTAVSAVTWALYEWRRLKSRRLASSDAEAG